MSFVDKCKVELLDHMGNDLDIANMARVSRHVENRESTDRDRILIENLAKNKHSTPFEAAVFKFKIACPIYIARQIFRHRMFSYNEVSRVYTNKGIEFFIGKYVYKNEKSFHLRNQSKLEDEEVQGYNYALRYVSDIAQRLYKIMIDQGIGNEYARAVLPQNLMTEFIMIGNLRSWHNFISLRSDDFNNVEIRDIAIEVREKIREFVPLAMKSLDEYRL